MSVAQLISAGIAVSFTSCLPHSWQQYSLILLRGGLFADKCDVLEQPCLSQEKHLGDLLSIFIAAWSGGGVLAGPCIDKLGPKLTAVIGQTMQILGTLLLAFSDNNHIVTIISLAIQGLFCNFILYAAMILSDFHPNHSTLVTAYVVSAQFLGALIPPMILLLWDQNSGWTFRNIWATYAVAIMLPISLLFIYTTPASRPIFREPSITVSSLSQLPSFILSITPTEQPGRGSAQSATWARESLDVVEYPAPKLNKSLWKEMCSESYLLILLLSSIPGLMHVYYPTVLKDMSGQGVSTFMGWMMVTQSLTCLLLGWVGNRLTSAKMMAIMNFMTGLIFVFSLIGMKWSSYTAAVIFVVSNSYVYNPRYTACRGGCVFLSL